MHIDFVVTCSWLTLLTLLLNDRNVINSWIYTWNRLTNSTRSSADAETARHASHSTRYWRGPNSAGSEVANMIWGTSSSCRCPHMVLFNLPNVIFYYCSIMIYDLDLTVADCRQSATLHIFHTPVVFIGRILNQWIPPCASTLCMQVAMTETNAAICWLLVFMALWSQSTNVIDGQTDGRHTRSISVTCNAYTACRGKNSYSTCKHVSF